MPTPFFPAWRARLAALGPRVQHVRQQSLLHLEQLWGRLIPPELLAQADEKANSRERVFPIRRTFWAFLCQALHPHCSCREAVRQVQALRHLHHQGPIDEDTSAYCQARRRLPLERLARIRQAAADHTEQLLPQDQMLWHGLRPKVIDGTGTTLPDTPQNQCAYPQSRSQKPGCGFPLLKLVAIFSLATGALLDYAKGNKHQHEAALLQRLLDQFQPGDVAIADRGFCSYVLMALLLCCRGVGSVFRLHQARVIDWRQGRRLGKNDRQFEWCKPSCKPWYLPKALWNRIPEVMTVRVLRLQLRVAGFRPKSVTLVTTLIDPEQFSAQDLALLYARRWRIELWFDDIKTTMGMERLSCKTPAMVHRELEMFFIAYNFIRGLMTEAAAVHQVPLERVSFKGTVDSARQYSIAIAQAKSKREQRRLVGCLLEVIAADLVPERPGRREPRAVKRRPKPYPLLNKPRRQFKDMPHRNRHWRNNPPKNRGLI